jgi:hypothetical protein
MKDMTEIVNKLVEDMETPADVPVAYEVWAIGYGQEDEPTGASMVLSTFNDPDQAVEYAKALMLADVINLAADDDYDDLSADTHSISIEVETVVPSDDEEELNMNVGTIYKKRLDVFTELPEFVCLSDNEYELIEETGNIQIPCSILKEYNKNDHITVLFTAEEQPWPIEYKIISKTTDGYYICEFV